MVDGYLEAQDWYQHSYALFRMLDTMQHGCYGLHELNSQAVYYNDALRRLHIVVRFARDAVERAGKAPDLPVVLRKRDDSRSWRNDFLDHIAELMFEVIFDTCAVRTPVDTNWAVQHNAVWSDFHRGVKTRAQKAVRFKLHRLLFDEIRRLEDLPNYKSAAILGYCLNVMGLRVGDRRGYGSEEYALRRAVLNWTRKNYLRLIEVQPDVAAAVPTGMVTFDTENSRFVKTYNKGLALEAPKEYLTLDPPSATTVT